MTAQIGDLRPYLIKVLHPNGTVNGTGVRCYPGGYVLTCYHVVSPWVALGQNKVQVIHRDRTWSADLLLERSTKVGDIAVLKLPPTEDGMSWELLPLDTRWRVEINHDLQSFGYPQRGSFSESGAPIACKLGGLTPTMVKGVEVYSIAGLNISNVDGGYSGAPLIDQHTQKVIGLMYATLEATQAFLVPLDKLFALWPELKAFHDVFQRIRETFAQEACSGLQAKLNNTHFVPLALEQGLVPGNEHDSEEKFAKPREATMRTYSREWEAMDLEKLLPPSGNYIHHILSANVGTGKTTFLYWLASRLAAETESVPLFMPCTELERAAVNDWQDLKEMVIARHSSTFLAVDLDDFFEQGFRERRLVFLFDGLDQISGSNYSQLVNTARRLAQSNAVLVASRPTAVLTLESDPAISFLRLQPFSASDQRHYFGECYIPAKRLAAMALELAQIPMLAYMILTLAQRGDAEAIANRTEIYRRFITHILTTHDPNRPVFLESSRARKIPDALRAIAYRALAEPLPQIQKVNEHLHDGDQGVSVEDLTRFGLVNLILEKGERPYLYFTHQSFQEFLAAQYLAEQEQEIGRVLAERWHPKWTEVIRFLCGLCGESVIHRILNEGDNVIHTNLFLAANCLLEQRLISPGLKASIKNELAKLAGCHPFRNDAVEALGALADPRLLLPYLNDRDREVRLATFHALARSSERPLLKAIGQAADEVYDYSDHNVAFRVLANLALTSIEKQSMPKKWISEITAHLIGMSVVNTWAGRIINALGDWIPHEISRALVDQLGTEDKTARLMAIVALKHLAEHLGEWLPPEGVHALSGTLEADDTKLRENAVIALGSYKEQLRDDVKRKLIGRLCDDSFEVRREAKEVLKRQGHDLSDTAIGDLARLLRDSRCGSYSRRIAIELLASQERRLPPDVIRELAEQLWDSDGDVREAAMKALPRLEEQLPEEIIHELTERLRGGEEAVRWTAMKVLISLKKHVPHISTELICEFENWLFETSNMNSDGLDEIQQQHVRNDILQQLVEAYPKEVIAELVKHFLDTESILYWCEIFSESYKPGLKDKQISLKGLGWWLTDDVLDRITRLVLDENGDVRKRAIAVLAEMEIGYRLSDDVLANAMQDLSNSEAAENLLCSAMKGSPERLIYQVKELLCDDDSDVREAAMKLLSCTKWLPGVDLLLARQIRYEGHCEVWTRASLLVTTLLMSLGWERLSEEAVQELADQLEDNESTVREFALLAIVRLGWEQMPRELIPRVAKYLDNNEDGIWTAVNYLSREIWYVAQRDRERNWQTLPSEWIRGLAKGLDDSHAPTRECTIFILGHLGKRLPFELVRKLPHFVSDTDGMVRHAAMEALVKLHWEDWQEIREDVLLGAAQSLRRYDKYDHSWAYGTLIHGLDVAGERLPPDAIADLSRWLQDDDEYVREAATIIMASLQEHPRREVIVELIAQLRDDRASIREGSTYLLGKLNWERVPLEVLCNDVVGELVGQLGVDDTNLREAAMGALEQVGKGLSPYVIGDLVNSLQDYDSKVRDAAMNALSGEGERLPVNMIKRLAEDLRHQSNATERKEAIEKLARFRTWLDTRGIQAIALGLQDSNEEVRTASYLALKALYHSGVALPMSKVANAQ